METQLKHMMNGGKTWALLVESVRNEHDRSAITLQYRVTDADLQNRFGI